MADECQTPEFSSLSDQSSPASPPNQAHKVTPPGRNGPISPPTTAERNAPSHSLSPSRLPQSLLDHERQVERGEVQPVTFIPLSAQEYSDNREGIERAFRRFDYEPQLGGVVLRMPSPTHEFFVNLFANCIADELKSIASQGGSTGDLASRIFNGGSSRILLDQDDNQEGDGNHEQGLRGVEGKSTGKQKTRRQPDAQFQHRDAARPGVVIEVAYSQQSRRLRRLAKQYIFDSNGDIKVVVGVSIGYGPDSSTLSLWKSRLTRESDEDVDTLDVDEVMRDEPFRTADGQNLNPDETLTLDLHEFVSDGLCQAAPSVTISIPFSKISELVHIAQVMQQVRESALVQPTRRVKKHRLSSSSLEELLSDDAAKMSDEENAIARRAEALDGDFGPRIAKRRG